MTKIILHPPPSIPLTTHLMPHSTRNNYLYSKNKLIAAVDVDGLVIVDMKDAILICKKDQSQNVRSIVEYLERNEIDSYL